MRRSMIGFFLAIICATALIGSADARITLGETARLSLRFNVLASNPGQAARDVRINLPVLVEEGLPFYQRLVAGASFSGPANYRRNGGDEAVFSLDTLAGGAQVELNLSYECEIRPATYHLPWFPRRRWPEVPRSLAKYLAPEEGIEADHQEILGFAQRKRGRSNDPVRRAKALYAATNLALTYDANAGKTTALEALRRGRASCEGYARLYAALCRAAGIPARLVYGLRLKQKELTKKEILADTARHVWNEVYLAGLGWVPVDPTFSYTVNGRKNVTYDYFARIGHHGDLHVVLGYNKQTISWNFRVPPGHPGLNVEHHIFLRLAD
ncbi:MAG: transglutaminase-like domain-containing protein [Bacteroidota bacterium]